MQKPIAAEKLFVPNFRPADKLVWNGNRFVVAPAGQLAYMTHPQTGRQMMVVEPTATNVMPHSSNMLPSNGWNVYGSGVTSQLVPSAVIPGGIAVQVGGPGDNYFGKYFGINTGSPQTLSVVVERGDVQTVRVGWQDDGQWLALVSYSWGNGDITIIEGTNFRGINTSAGVLHLSDDVKLIWCTSTLGPGFPAGSSRRFFGYGAISSEVGNGNIFHHVQFEQSPYWTSPVVTGATALTRAGDVLRIDDYDKKVIGADSSGSMFVEYEYPMGVLDSNNYYLFTETVDGLSTARQMIYPVGIANRERAYIYQNGTSSIANITNLDAVGVIRKAAASFGADSLAVALNGSGASAVNTTGLIAGINQAAISLNAGITTRPIWVSKIWRDHTVRTAAELEEMTS